MEMNAGHNRGQPALGPQLVYPTVSLCPKCTFYDKIGMIYRKALVEECDGKIWLRVECEKHGSMSSLYCKDASFFRRTLARSAGAHKELKDIEDMKKYVTPTQENLPLTMELNMYKNQEFLSDDQLAVQVASLRHLFPVGHKFVLKASARTAPDMDELNAKLLFVFSQLLPGELMLVNASHDRLIALSEFENSIMLKPRVYPAMKYYLRAGDEALCLKELKELLSALQIVSDMKMVVTISLELPLPNISELLAFIRQQRGFIKLIEFSLERSPRQIMDSIARSVEEPQQQQGGPATSTTIYTDAVDLLTTLDYLAEMSQNGPSSAQHPHVLTRDDFVPVTTGAMLSPFIDLMGYGKFSIKPPAYCGFGTCLLNMPDQGMFSIPVTQYVDLIKFHDLLCPLLPKLEKEGIGWWSGRSIKKYLKSSSKKKLPDVLGYLVDKSKVDLINTFIDNIQFLIVHNHMDLAMLDLTRRCHCASLTYDDGRLVASCAGCT